MKSAASLMTLIIGLFISSASEAKLYEPGEYPFPIQDKYWATIASALDGTQAEYLIHHIEMRSERASVPLLEDRHRVPINVFRQSSPRAPVVFIISGLGGTAFSGTTLQLAEFFYKAGFHAVTLPNSMSWHYALGVSQSGAPGHLPTDAPEYYEFLKQVDRSLRLNLKLKPTSYSLVGTSYGALLAAFLKDLDRTSQSFHFARTLLINPAVDIRHGIETLDSFFAAGQSLSPRTKEYIQGMAIGTALELLSRPGITAPEILNGIQSRLPLSEKEKKWLIGNSFRDSLADIVFVSQQIQDQRILREPASRYVRSARLAESKRVSFSSYISTIVIPRNSLRGPIADLLWNASLYPVLTRIGQDPSVFVQDNRDDFLLKTSDVEYLTRTLQDRLYLYPYGGHAGNTRFPINLQDINAIFGAAR
ncbi:MAG: hypothetical protein NDI61_03955 [Bdellovibrionaceae bacterium]|nr:hypothetical protein [Pseudobdellovibrionaceae bacterium]